MIQVELRGSAVEEQRDLVIHSLLDAIGPDAARRSVAEVRLGLGYTAVVLDDGQAGVAYTLRDESEAGCSVLQEAGSLQGQRADRIISRALTDLPLWRSIAMATINAMAPEGKFPELDGNILDSLHISKDDRLGMVGYFAPLMTLENRVKEIVVLENKVLEDGRVQPSHRAPEVLPSCNVILLTAVTVINGTFNSLIGHCAKAREIVLLGPSTPMYPYIFASYGITWLSGIRVVDTSELLRIISEGAGARQFGKTVCKVNIRVLKS
jgi:uncharacterized protein (DUF4213/DUF364 family)